MKRFFTLLIILLSIGGFAQNFHFEPDNVLTKTINTDGISDLNIDIIRDNTIDTLHLEYELITNTLPTEWYQGYCDNHGCWGSLPESGYMSPCYDDLNSFIRLSIDPIGTEGSGTVEYYVYEIGDYDNGLLMTFNIDTPGFVGTEEINSIDFSLIPNPAKDFVRLTSKQEIKNAGIYSLTGQLIKEISAEELRSSIDLTQIERGIYLLNAYDVSGNQLTKKLRVD